MYTYVCICAYIYIYIYCIHTGSSMWRDLECGPAGYFRCTCAALGSGQMGSTLMGSLQTYYCLTEGTFGYSRQIYVPLCVLSFLSKASSTWYMCTYMCVYIYIYIYTSLSLYIYIYIHITISPQPRHPRPSFSRRFGSWDHTNPPHPHHPLLNQLTFGFIKFKNLLNTQH